LIKELIFSKISAISKEKKAKYKNTGSSFMGERHGESGL